MAVFSRGLKRVISAEVPEEKPKIKDVEAFLDGKTQLFQAPPTGSFLGALTTNGPMTMQLVDSNGIVVATAPVQNLTTHLNGPGVMEMSIEVTFTQF